MSQRHVPGIRVLDEPPRLADEADPQGESLPRAAQAIAKADGREVIIAEDRQKAEAQLRVRAAQGKARAAEQADAINRLLSSTNSALLLAQAVADEGIPQNVRSQVLSAAMARPESQVRDLPPPRPFEPADQLDGSAIDQVRVPVPMHRDLPRVEAEPVPAIPQYEPADG